MVWISIGIFCALLAFITFDLARTRYSPRTPNCQMTDLIKIETRRLVQIEADVDLKLSELRRQAALTAPAPAPACCRDPLDETRCAKTVREKVAEVEDLKNLLHRESRDV